MQELLLELRDATEDLTHELGRLPGSSELAARLGVTTEELNDALQAEGMEAIASLWATCPAASSASC